MAGHGGAIVVAEHLSDPCDDVRRNAIAAQVPQRLRQEAGGRSGAGEPAGRGVAERDRTVADLDRPRRTVRPPLLRCLHRVIPWGRG